MDRTAFSAELMAKYGLPHDVVEDAVAAAMEGTLRDVFGRAVFPVVDSGTIEIFIAGRDDASLELKKMDASAISRKLRRHLVYSIERELCLRKVDRDAATYASLRSQIVQGSVARVAESGCLEVEIEVQHFLSRSTLRALCPLRHQPPHEREEYRQGRQLSFLVSTVRPVQVGGMPKLDVMLSRTSRALTEGLLKAGLGAVENRICCHRRIPGAFSLVKAEKRIDRQIIRSVADELKEQVVVRY